MVGVPWVCSDSTQLVCYQVSKHMNKMEGYYHGQRRTVEIHRQLTEGYGQRDTAQKTLHNWAKRFAKGWKIEHKNMSTSRPSASFTLANNVSVLSMAYNTQKLLGSGAWQRLWVCHPVYRDSRGIEHEQHEPTLGCTEPDRNTGQKCWTLSLAVGIPLSL